MWEGERGDIKQKNIKQKKKEEENKKKLLRVYYICGKIPVPWTLFKCL